MSFVPSVPGFSPVSYGQGYGDWQQYAGYDKSNPFGGGGGLGVIPPQAQAKPPEKPFVAPTGELPKTDYSLKPVAPFGTTATNTFGTAPQSQFGTPSFLDQIKKDETQY